MVRHSIVAAIAAFYAVAPVQAANLNFVSWGGVWQETQESTAIKPFMAKNKVAVKTDVYNGGISQLSAQAKTGNVTWDVIDMQLSDAMRACDEGLLEKISPSDLSPGKDGKLAVDDYIPGGLSDCLAGNIVWSTLFAYDKTKVGATPPSKVADFFDLKRYPGKRGLQKSPQGALEWALLADGVKPADVYKALRTPAGVARAFRKLDTIKSSIIWWEVGAQPPQLLSDGAVVMTSAYVNRIYDSIAKYNKPFEFVWDGQIKNIEGYAIAKGTKNLNEAKAFVRHATEAEQLAALASLNAEGPARKSAMGLVDAKVLPYLPTNPKNLPGSLDVDFQFWADHQDDLNQKFAVWLGRN